MLAEDEDQPIEQIRDRTAQRRPGITYIVFGFIAWSYICVHYVALVPLLMASPSVSVILLFFFISLGALLTVYNYYKAIYTSPGHPPEDWRPPNATEEELNEAIKSATYTRDSSLKKGQRLIRYCAKCSCFKPPRAHHCSECNKCVLKMDHHCPWIDNCVGHANHKYFLLFLFYGITSQLATLVLYGATITRWSLLAQQTSPPGGSMASSFSAARMLMLLFDVMFMLPAVLGMTGLLCFQMCLVRANTTNIETFELELTQHDRSGSKPPRWMYDRGGCENLHEVLGDSVWTWLVPTPVAGDGIRWRRSTLASTVEEA